MAGSWPFGEIVTRLRREPLLDPGGKPQRDNRGQPMYGPESAVDVKGCVVTPRQEAPQVGGTEQQARDTVITGYTVYAPSGSEWRTTDRVRIRGEVCEITGEPGEWLRSPFTGTRGPVQFAADRVTG
jgi:hypothetical protein